METGLDFCCPRFIFSELFKHKERIIAATDLAEDELLDALNSLFAHIQFVDESAIPLGVWLKRGGCVPALTKKIRHSSRWQFI